MKLPRTLVGVLLATLSSAVPAADADHGRDLYESACIGCHGSSVHARSPKSVRSCVELRATVVRFGDLQGRNWDVRDVDDVTTWLNRRYYGFPMTDGRCVTPVAAMPSAGTRTR